MTIQKNKSSPKLRLQHSAMRIFTALLIIFCATPCSFAKPGKENPPVTVKAAVGKRLVSIGEKIKYTVSISADKYMEIELFDFGKNLDNFTIKDFGSDKKISLRKQKITSWYLLDTFTTGKLIIPKQTIKYRKRGETGWNEIEVEPQEIEVKSMLAKAGPATVFEDIEGPVNLPSKSRAFLVFFTVIAAAGLTLTGVIFLKNKAVKQPRVIKAAHEVAYEALQALRKKNLITQGKIQEFYYEISNITRHYIENRFNIKAPDMTTEEFLISVKDYSELNREHKTLLREFLSCCDLVKFAKYTPGPQEIDSAFESAENFVKQTARTAQCAVPT